jgi:hypothetical protein
VRLAANFGMVLGSRWSVNETASIRRCGANRTPYCLIEQIKLLRLTDQTQSSMLMAVGAS